MEPVLQRCDCVGVSSIQRSRWFTTMRPQRLNQQGALFGKLRMDVGKRCGEVLFDSSSKYDSGSGWPSFDRPADARVIHYQEDHSHGMHRVEVSCEHCGSHLGHVFDDGPRDTTGKRYCVNSLSLDFRAGDDE